MEVKLTLEEAMVIAEEERREHHIVVFLVSLIGTALIYSAFILGFLL